MKVPTLRELRQQRGLSLEAVAYLAGVDIATISRIERGLAEARPMTVVKLASALGVAAKRMAAILGKERDRQIRTRTAVLEAGLDADALAKAVALDNVAPLFQ